MPTQTDTLCRQTQGHGIYRAEHSSHGKRECKTNTASGRLSLLYRPANAMNLLVFASKPLVVSRAGTLHYSQTPSVRFVAKQVVQQIAQMEFGF